MSYWDTSCLVKLYTPEQDSGIFRAHAIRSVTPIVSSEVARFEMWTTLRRKEWESVLAPGEASLVMQVFEADAAAGNLRLLPATPLMAPGFRRIVDSSFNLSPPLVVRTLDAIHLAAAEMSGETEVVATDSRIRTVAKALGFAIFPLP